MKKVKKFFVVVLSLFVCVECIFAYGLYFKSRSTAEIIEYGLIVDGNVYGDIGESIDPSYVSVTLPEDYCFDDATIGADKSLIDVNLSGLLEYDIAFINEDEITLVFSGLVNSELMQEIIITINGDYIIYDGSDVQSGSVWTNSDDSNAYYFIEAAGSPSASLKEDKNYTFKVGNTVSKDLIEIDIDNDAIVGNTYTIDDSFNGLTYKGLTLKVDSFVMYGEYIKKMYIYFDGTPTEAGELTINDLLIPSTSRVSSVAADGYKGIITSNDLPVLGEIKICVNEDTPIEPMHYDPPIDYDPVFVK